MQRTQHINLSEGAEAVIAKKKSLIMLVCALMIVSSVAFGTIAYLTDRAGVTNRGLPPVFVPTSELVKTVSWHPHSFIGLATS